MESRIDLTYLQSYAKKFSDYILAEKFASHPGKIKGVDIIKGTPVKQINLFVVRRIFTQWKKELNQLKSPFFDYDNPEIKEALQSFMGTLSHHIAMDRETYASLVEQATVDTIKLVETPYYFIKENFLSPESEKIKISLLRENLKYFDLNRSLMEALISAVDFGPAYVPIVSALDKFTRVYQDEAIHFAEPDAILAKLDGCVPLDYSLIKMDRETPASADETASTEEPKMEGEVRDQKKTVENTSLHQKFEREKQTLNDRYTGPGKNTLLDKHRKIVSVKSAISLNQKLMFIQELFNGEQFEYENAMKEVDHSQNLDDASDILINVYAKKYNWDPESPEVKELFEVVARKY